MNVLFRVRQRIPDFRLVWGAVVFVGALLLTSLVWVHVKGVLSDNAQKRFDDIAILQRDVLINRMKDYEQVLLGAAGLFASSQQVDRAEWRSYVEELRLHLTLPGIQGVGYVEMVSPRDKAAHEARIRREGYPNYVISPPGERDMYSAIIYLEPFSGRNLRAFGYDMYAEPVRHAAMQRAADTRDPAWSGKVKLIQEDSQAKPQPGFLVYVAVYAKNKPLRTVEERREALLGFVYSPFRAGDMLSQLYQDQNRFFELQLYAGAPVAENLLYETAPPAAHAEFERSLPVAIGGTEWTAVFRSNAHFYAEEHRDLPLILFLLALLMETLLFVIFVIDVRHRRKSESAARELEKNNHEIRLMSTLTDLLQNCIREDETYPIIDRFMLDMFPGVSGGCYLLNHSETQLELISAWGADGADLVPYFKPEACWSYRRGQRHWVGFNDGAHIRCHHVHSTTAAYTCIPLLAQGKVMGDLFMMQREAGAIPEADFSRYVDLLGSVADSISLSLANLRLRSSLRDLSIRDSLTGLYNRRYMEEGLDRELERAHRQQHNVAIVMLDVDHFKDCNDSYGHEVGDLVLKRIAEHLKHFRGGSDIPCRYGGEEFLLILPDIANDVLTTRLEQLRRDIQQMRVTHDDKILPEMTISIGVACYPQDGLEPSELVRLADEAMYKAKRRGRNRVELAHAVPDAVPPLS